MFCVAGETPPRILHVGCGSAPLPEWMGEAIETRLDINSQVNPDIVAPMTDMGDIGLFDVVYSSHCLEHIYRHQVVPALQECLRVLRPGGLAIMIVPDVEDIKPTNDVVYVSPGGPVTGLDMFFGHGGCVRDNPYMEHHGAFVQSTLIKAFKDAGFREAKALRGNGWNLVGVGGK